MSTKSMRSLSTMVCSHSSKFPASSGNATVDDDERQQFRHSSGIVLGQTFEYRTNPNCSAALFAAMNTLRCRQRGHDFAIAAWGEIPPASHFVSYMDAEDYLRPFLDEEAAGPLAGANVVGQGVVGQDAGGSGEDDAGGSDESLESDDDNAGMSDTDQEDANPDEELSDNDSDSGSAFSADA